MAKTSHFGCEDVGSTPAWIAIQLAIINYQLKKNETIVTDMGLSFVGTHQAFKIKKGQKLYTNSGHAPMGWGLPAAIGASYAKNKRKVI